MEPKKTTVVKPKRLQPGDTIGVAAPAGPFDAAKFEQGVAVIESMGFAVKIPQNLGRTDGFLAGSDEHRAALIHDLLADPGVQGIICARGGYGSMRILDRMDYRMIQQNPKVFIGFSDITALLMSIYRRCNLVTFHGPVATYLGKADQETLQALWAAVASDIPLKVSAKDGKVIRSGCSSGIVCGGNLTTLCHLTGTPFAPVFKGCILVLEETNEAPYRLDRMLFQMRLAGCFDGVCGIALGSFDNCGDPDEVLGVMQRMFQNLDIPVLAGLDIGHGKTNITIPMGIWATLDTNSRSLIFDEAATK